MGEDVAPLSDNGDEAVICIIRYRLDLSKVEAFERYAALWIALINRHGGHHHGYFLPTTGPHTGFSFPGVGKAGPDDVATAMFSFPSEQAYHRYRQSVSADPDCGSAEAIFREAGCFLEYERSFVRRLGRE